MRGFNSSESLLKHQNVSKLHKVSHKNDDYNKKYNQMEKKNNYNEKIILIFINKLFIFYILILKFKKKNIEEYINKLKEEHNISTNEVTLEKKHYIYTIS